MAERSENPMSSEEALKRMVEALGSQTSKKVFSRLSDSERSQLISTLRGHTRQLVDLHNLLIGRGRRDQKRKLGLEFSTLERVHPERAIARLFRLGRYLKFDGSNEILLNGLPMSMQTLANSSKEHVEQFGRDSIAHLCLPVELMNVLTSGLYVIKDDALIVEPDERYKIKIDRIDQLRRVLFAPGVQLCKLETVYPARVRRFKRIQKGGERLGAKLAEWDAIPQAEAGSP